MNAERKAKVMGMIMGTMFMALTTTTYADYYENSVHPGRATHIKGKVDRIVLDHRETGWMRRGYLRLKNYSVTGDAESIGTNTGSDGYLVFDRTDQNLMAIILSARNNDEEITIRIWRADYGYNRIAFVVY